MNIAYYSKRGTIESIVSNLKNEKVRINDGNEVINKEYVLFVPTYGNGEIPEEVIKFLNGNNKYLKAVVGSGSMARHAETFNFASIKISEKYNVPILKNFDGAGTKEDLIEINNILKEYK